MVRKKTSVYIDEELWKKVKKIASELDLEVSFLLEEMIREEIGENAEAALRDMVDTFISELDFEPVKLREGLVSELVREMRDERSDRISRQ